MRAHRTIPLVALAAALLAPPTRAGDLAPPPGPLGPTMKTLAEVEPRTPITQADLPLTITETGSYYLAGNITLDSATAITINATGVTLDLSGFTITGGAHAAAIRVESGAGYARIHSGRITGALHGVFGAGRGARIENLVIDAGASFNTANAGGVRPGPHWLVSGCEVRDYAGAGAAGVLAATSSSQAGGLHVERCRFIDCAAGVRASASPVLVQDSQFRSCIDAVVLFGGLKDGLVTDCIATLCSTGFTDSGQVGQNLFTRNQALGCTTGYVGIANVAASLGAAAALDNIAY